MILIPIMMVSSKYSCWYLTLLTRCSSLLVFAPLSLQLQSSLLPLSMQSWMVWLNHHWFVLVFLLLPTAICYTTEPGDPMQVPAIFFCCTFVFDWDFSGIISSICCHFQTNALVFLCFPPLILCCHWCTILLIAFASFFLKFVVICDICKLIKSIVPLHFQQ